ncbi:universal stress protein [Methanosarcinales archaeon]|nr:MAG: universal stress protein [Methanosarcinales archaeon]
MYKKILVPYDGSSNAEKAVGHAIELAKALPETPQITLLNVIDVHYIVQIAESIYVDMESLEAYSRSVLTAMKEKIKDDIPVEIAVKSGRPWEEIVNEAEEGKYDLIVMGSHGLGFIDRLLVGSTTQGVLRHAKCPVLVINSDREG